MHILLKRSPVGDALKDEALELDRIGSGSQLSTHSLSETRSSLCLKWTCNRLQADRDERVCYRSAIPPFRQWSPVVARSRPLITNSIRETRAPALIPIRARMFVNHDYSSSNVF